eukprot:g3654.t1
MLLSFCEHVLTATFLILDAALGLVYWPVMWLFSDGPRRPESGGGAPAVASEATRTVVIVGGSFGGLTALRGLTNYPNIRVVLVDQRKYFEYVPGVLRLFCDPSLHASITRPMPGQSPSSFTSHEFVHGRVKRIDESSVVVRTFGESDDANTADKAAEITIPYDYIVIATGADYRAPITPLPNETNFRTRHLTWNEQAARLKAAKSVLILGGGAVGTELAAEIACHFPDKTISIVDGQERLLPLFPRATSDHATRWFEDRGVELLMGQTISDITDKGCFLKKAGRTLEADLVFVCFGMRPNTAMIKDGDMSACLTDRGVIQVNEHLQVEGFPRAFAVGDAMVHPAKEIKQAYYAELNGKAAAENILRCIVKKPLLKYPDDIVGAPVSPLVYVVSLGRYDGSLGFNQLTINGSLAALVKFVLEWTKVKQMEGRPIGLAVWAFGDAMSFFLSKWVLKPKSAL